MTPIAGISHLNRNIMPGRIHPLTNHRKRPHHSFSKEMQSFQKDDIADGDLSYSKLVRGLVDRANHNTRLAREWIRGERQDTKCPITLVGI